MSHRRPLGAIALALGVPMVMALPAAGGPAEGSRSRADVALVAPSGHGAAARAAVAALPGATWVNDHDSNKLFDDLDAAYSRDATRRIPVIVSFVEGTATRRGVARVAGVAPNARIRRTFTIIPAFAGDLTGAEALRVAALSQVRQIELDRRGAPELDTATKVMGADAAVDELGVTGSLDGDAASVTKGDVGIAVLDTGFHVAHRDLGGKLVAWKDFGTNRATPYDPGGHGTHVASIAAGWGKGNAEFRGVAPGASIIGIKIDGGGNTTTNAIAGYEWIVARKAEHNIRVATISFGFGIATDGTTALERAVDAAWDAGIVCFKSNGNSGPARATMTVPAAARGILAIGSLLDPLGSGSTKYGFVLSEYSSRGPTSDGRIKPDLTAPGESINAAQAGSTNGYVVMSGTSMASPFAAGTAALMIGADPSLTPDAVRSMLFATAEDRGAMGPDNDFGHGRIQTWHAVLAALQRAGAEIPPSTPPAAPRHETAAGSPATGLFEKTFTVHDVGFPVAVTVLGDMFVNAVAVFDQTGALVGTPTAVYNVSDRQHHFTFLPSAPGTYTLRAVVPPTSAVVADISHSTAP